MLVSKPNLQTQVKILRNDLNCLFWDGFQFDNTMRDAEAIGVQFLSTVIKRWL